MKLISLNVGKPEELMYNGKSIQSGILKTPVKDVVFLSKKGFAGDGQADMVNHGGEDKAACVYAHEHYNYWETTLGKPLSFGAFGENMTVKGLLETHVHIGDVFQIGEAIVQISQPRQPCFKLAAKHKEPKLPLYVQETGFTGFYFRVLQEGFVCSGDAFLCIRKHSLNVTVDFANQTMYSKQPSREALEQVTAVEELAESWQSALSNKRTS